MATKTIAWGDGTSDKIIVTYSGDVGSSQPAVTSDPNKTVNSRGKTIIFKNTGGVVLDMLTVIQKPRSCAYSAAYSSAYPYLPNQT